MLLQSINYDIYTLHIYLNYINSLNYIKVIKNYLHSMYFRKVNHMKGVAFRRNYIGTMIPENYLKCIKSKYIKNSK